MEDALKKLAESAAKGGWPAAVAISVTAACCSGAVIGIAWAFAWMLK